MTKLLKENHMKSSTWNILLGLFLAVFVSTNGYALNCGPRGPFSQTIYLSGATGSGTGLNPNSPLPFLDGDLWAIPAGTQIDSVTFYIDTAITGTTVLEVGDDDDADGFMPDIAGSFATTGGYNLSAKVAGAYLRVQTAGATDAADIYVVPASKFYAAAGKEVKLNITTTNTAGKVRVLISGYCLGTNP